MTSDYTTEKLQEQKLKLKIHELIEEFGYDEVFGTINDLKYLQRPKLVNRSRCYTYHEECFDCGGKSFRYYGNSYGKKYYQCEKCRAINH